MALQLKNSKKLIECWPEENEYGEPTEVWILNKDHTSSPCIMTITLNYRTNNEDGSEYADILLCPL